MGGGGFFGAGFTIIGELVTGSFCTLKVTLSASKFVVDGVAVFKAENVTPSASRVAA